MKFQPTMEAAILGTKFVVSAFACWPLSPDAKPSEVRRRNLWWWFIFVHLITSSIASVYNIYLNLDNYGEAVKVSTEFSTLVSNGVKMVICKVEGPRLQGLFAELQAFLNQATSEEMKLIQFYVDKCFFTHLTVFILCFIGVFAFIAGPVVLPQPLPGEAVYPFSTEPFWIWLVLYISQSFLVLQVGGMVTANFIYTILMWFAVARFEIICLELQRATTADDLKRCVLKHQELIEYTDRVRRTTRPMALHVISYTVFSSTTGGFLITRNPPFYELVKYILYNFVSGVQFFLLTWPADNLIDMSGKIGGSAYNAAWIGKPKMLKDILIIAQRSQFPLRIAIDGLLPALSLELFGSAVSATFSYLAALRAIAEE